jgi:hypothetical protein
LDFYIKHSYNKRPVEFLNFSLVSNFGQFGIPFVFAFANY